MKIGALSRFQTSRAGCWFRSTAQRHEAHGWAL